MKKDRKKTPALGAMIVLSMNRGRVFINRKKQIQKWACRKSKGLKKEIPEYLYSRDF